MTKINRFAEMHGEITAWRRDIHQHPEIMFETHRTSALVADKLRAFGCDEVVEGIGRTGVVGVIKGKQNSSGKVIGMRADMDALPIQETTGLEYASKTDGAMHACGHDGHTAMLLGAAKYLSETRNFNGSVVVIFQPAEEGGGGGKEMVEDGMMERFGIQEVFGMHCSPGLEVGQFAMRTGPIMAAMDQFTVQIEGVAGHAAFPSECVDAAMVASHVVIALQSIVARNIDPMDSVVVSVTSIETDTKAYNIIPQNAELRGTCRTLSNENRELVEQRVRKICENTALAFGATAVVEYKKGYPVTINHPEQTELAAMVARDVAGDSNVNANITPSMGAEDFSYMLNARPGAFIYVGNGDSATWHHPDFNFDDEMIPTGCSYWARLAEMQMPAD